MKQYPFIQWPVLVLMLSLVYGIPCPAAVDNTMPASPVKLVFIHHSTGGNWLADPNTEQPYGNLGTALKNNNYYVSATNYGWGPGGIGDNTDIPHSDLYGNPSDPAASAPDGSYTVSNAKAVYNNLLTYFQTRTDKLFVVITAPPQNENDYGEDIQTAFQRAANARAFNHQYQQFPIPVRHADLI